jgi:hypothetical protein
LDGDQIEATEHMRNNFQRPRRSILRAQIGDIPGR